MRTIEITRPVMIDFLISRGFSVLPNARLVYQVGIDLSIEIEDDAEVEVHFDDKTQA